MMDNGLHFTDLGARGLIVETREPAYTLAQDRHAHLQAQAAILTGLSPGAAVVVAALAEGLILHWSTFDAWLTAGRSKLYSNDMGFEIELELPGGWRDRRILPGRLVEVIRANRGVAVERKHLAEAASTIGSVCGFSESTDSLGMAIADAQAWWFRRLPGPLFAHASRRKPFQLLDRAARARLTHRNPQRCDPSADESRVDSLRQAFEGCFCQTADLSVVDELVRQFGRIARDKGSKPRGVELMKDSIDRLMPRAVQAGRAQTLVLGGIGFVLVHGGVRGVTLAPVSIYEYCRLHLEGLTLALTEDGVDQRDGDQWLATYRLLVEAVPQSQRRKLSAFLQAFHSFLVLVGMSRLPAAIAADQLPIPPSASVVTEHELQLALAFVREHAETQQIAAQASISLLLGFEIELRTYELWCIRMVDVQLEGAPYIVLYPRPLDGACKTASLRRQEDLHGPALLKLLVAFKRKRLAADFALDDEDLFFGTPGAPDERHELAKTMRLVNAALTWATGKRGASFYDLRHTTFSRKVRQILMTEDSTTSDVARFFQVSAEGGHAGPGSTWAYVHQIEEPLALWSRRARPESWRAPVAHALDAALFPDIGFGCLLPARAAPPPRRVEAAEAPVKAFEHQFELYADIARRLVCREDIEQIAGRCSLHPDAVLVAVSSIARALADAGLSEEDEPTTTSRQVLQVWRHRTWITAASHPKLAPVKKRLGKLLAERGVDAVTAVWHAWVRCVQGADLSLDRARPASVLIHFLLVAGISRSALAITAAPSSLPLPPHLDIHKLSVRKSAPSAVFHSVWYLSDCWRESPSGECRGRSWSK